MLNQKLQQRLIQKLSPQQVLVMRLLQEPLLALEQRIKQEIEENPALEEAGPEEEQAETEIIDDTPVDSVESDEDEFHDEEPEEITKSAEDDFDFEDYLAEDEIPEYRLYTNNSSPDDEVRESPLASGVSFQEHLLSQLGMHRVTDKQYIIASTIIGNIDESGYLHREIPAMVDDLAFNHGIEATEEEVAEVLKIIQSFDPPGIAARNLQECLSLQIERLPDRSDGIALAKVIIREHFTEFSKKHYDKIMLKTRASESSLKEAIVEIQKLNPKPGVSISDISREGNYIIPDFTITNSDGELELSLNSRNVPDLIPNRTYIDMLREYSAAGKNATKSTKDAAMFIRQKLDAARGFIDAIRQRQETLYITMMAIMEYQKEYFMTGDETKLKPMILKDIATIIRMDISTVSRVANSKYVQTPFGTFLLKSFFSESMQNTEGVEVSTREIKKILQDCIEAEDKSDPLTDDHLVDVLKEKGYNIARRTIAKYREQLSIPVARMRKEL
ncbi:MAG: RNA polymerase factor sigma-54 [Bacteroidetes bacterium]|nr:RNA polymerase factor sigma-54 [Bacteroidota bacterium]